MVRLGTTRGNYGLMNSLMVNVHIPDMVGKNGVRLIIGDRLFNSFNY